MLGRQQRQTNRHRVNQHRRARAGQHQRGEGKQERRNVQHQTVAGAQHQDGLHHHQIDGRHQVGSDRGAIEVELHARNIQPQSLIEGIAVDRQTGNEGHDDQQALHAQPFIERNQQNESGRELQFAGRHIGTINIDIFARLFEMMHPQDGAHADTEHQRGQQQIFNVAEVVARIQANGDKGDVAGNVKQIASGRGTERNGAKSDGTSQINQITEGRVRRFLF
ncbi:Uncharacterised protein [Acinetobacter baumannii]|nr:Uncharacterised protein [Acinetobacter baumannii]